MIPALASRMRTKDTGRSAGLATAVTTVGNVVGALLAGLWFIPAAGLQSTLRAIALVALALSVLCAFGVDRVRPWSTLAAALLAVGLGAWLDRPWDAVALSAGTYRTGLNRGLHERRDAPCGPGRRLPDTRVLFHRDGALGTVTVLSHSDRTRCTLYGLRVNGKTEGSVFVPAPPSPRGCDAVALDHWLPVGHLPSEPLPGRRVRSLLVPSPCPPCRSGWGTWNPHPALPKVSGAPIIAAQT